MLCPKIGVTLLAALSVFACSGSGTIGEKHDPIAGGPCETPGDTAAMDDGCNECTCGSDRIWGCTDVACAAPCVEGGAEYPDGASWTCSDGCNACSCADGVVTSTNVACTEPGCEPGEETIQGDGCNTCVCGDDRRWACTELVCGAHCSVPDVALFVAHGTSFHRPDNCDDCRCEHGVVTCTDGGGCESCIVGDREYAHGESWPCDCNTCFCDNGSIGSTLALCFECQPGEVKVADDLCNTCACDDIGQWSCTSNECAVASCTQDSDCQPFNECTDTCAPPSCRRSACVNDRCALVENPCSAETCNAVSDCPPLPPSAECLQNEAPCWARDCIDNTCVAVTALTETAQ